MTLRSCLLTISLLAAFPAALAQQKPAAISIMTGPPMAAGAAAAATPPAGQAVQASTVKIGLGQAANMSTTALGAVQTGSSTTGAAGTAGTVGTAGAQNVWVIKAGSTNGSLTFTPDTMTAAVGDMVQFQFYPRNHSVVMGDFAKPCEPIANTDPMAFFSGFMPTSANGQLTYSVMVKDTKPMFMYCSQAKHCQEGMVAVINPPADGSQTLADYKQRAAQAANNVSPAAASGGTGTSAAPTAGQIGGTTGATPSGPSVAPATTTKASSSGTVFRISSWGLLGVAVVVGFAL